MDIIEKTIQKNVINLVKYLPRHLDTWKINVEGILSSIRVLSNQCEQLEHVEQANIEYLDNFEDLQRALSCKISRELHDTLAGIHLKMNNLKQAHNDLRNKLFTLEKTTAPLDWNLNSELIKGNALQPPLNELLDLTLNFYIFFQEITIEISTKFNEINVRNKKSLRSLQNCLENIKFNNSNITYLIAITQYIEGECSS